MDREETLLWNAIRTQPLVEVKKLIKQVKNINFHYSYDSTDQGQTLLMHLCEMHGRGTIRKDVLRLLLDSGADPNHKGGYKHWKFDPSTQRYSVLVETVHARDPKACHILLQHGADPNMILNNTTALMEACRYLLPDMVRLLLQYKADPNLEISGKNAFNHIYFDHIIMFPSKKKAEKVGEIVHLLIDRGIKVKKDKLFEKLYSPGQNIIRELLNNVGVY